MKPKKSFGQVFLRDKNYIQKIVNHLCIDKESVVEIGPGRGEITRYLVNKAKYLYGIEKDLSLVSLLQKEFLTQSVSIFNKDILKFDLSSLNTDVVIFGNIPFNISNQLIKYLVENRQYIKTAYLTFQKEFAQKLVATKGIKDRTFLSCYIQYYSRVSLIFDIPKSAFFPKPKVDASFVEIRFLKKLPLGPREEGFLFKVIRKAFTLRRKKLINALEGLCDKEKIKKSLQEVGLGENLRAENLSLNDYLRLANALLSY